MDTKQLTRAAAQLGTNSPAIVVKDDTRVTVIAKEVDANAQRAEYTVSDLVSDFFQDEYGSTEAHGTANTLKRSSVQILKPPIPPNMLEEKVLHNNTLQPLVHAMDVNCETTGHTLVLREGFDGNNPEVLRQRAYANALFSQPYPNCSMTSVRRELRANKETIGYGAIEVIRNNAGEIAFLRTIPSNEIRVLKMDKNDPVETVSVEREGMPDATLPVRRRRYVRLVDGRKRRQYFKEFGTEDELDAKTGQWLNIPETVLRQKGSLPELFTNGPPSGTFSDPESSRFLNPQGDPNNLNPAALNPSAAGTGEDGARGQAEFHKLANEIIWFTLHKDPQGPYGYPRWISQLPSVLGSRAAEETNFHLLEGGGIPPVLVTITGGTLSDQSRKQLEAYLNTPNKDQRMQAAIVEILNTGGSIDGADTNARIEVHRFGGEELNDAMFQQYDEGCSLKIRGSFRLGGVFIGRVDDANRANSVAQYVSAETQVFRPERVEFDEVINTTIMAEIAPAWRFCSNHQTFTDIISKIAAMTQMKGEVIRDDWVDAMGYVAGVPLDRTHARPNEPGDDEEEAVISSPEGVLKSTDDIVDSPMMRLLFNTSDESDIATLEGLDEEDFETHCRECARHIYGEEDMAPILEQQVREGMA